MFVPLFVVSDILDFPRCNLRSARTPRSSVLTIIYCQFWRDLKILASFIFLNHTSNCLLLVLLPCKGACLIAINPFNWFVFNCHPIKMWSRDGYCSINAKYRCCLLWLPTRQHCHCHASKILCVFEYNFSENCQGHSIFIMVQSFTSIFPSPLLWLVVASGMAARPKYN